MLDPTSDEQMLYQALLSTKDVNAVILDFERAHREVSQRRVSIHRIPSPAEEVERTPSRVPSPPAADLLGLFSPLSPLETYLAGKSGTYVGVPLRSPPMPSAVVHSSAPVTPVPQPTTVDPKKYHKSHRRDNSPSSRSSSSTGSSSSDRSQLTRRKAKKETKKAPKAGVRVAVQPVAPNGGAVKKVVKKVMVSSKKATPVGSTVAASKPSTPKLTTEKAPTSVSPQPLKPAIQQTTSTLNTQQQQHQQPQPQKDFVDNYPFQSQVAVSPGRAFRNQPYQQSTPLAPSPTMEPSQFKRLLLSAGMVVPSGSGGYTASPDGSLAPQDRYVDAPNTSAGPQVRRYPNQSGMSQMSERAPQTASEPPNNSVPTFPSAPNITAYFSTGHGSTVTPLVTHWSQPALYINREVLTVYRPANAISVPIQPDHYNHVTAPSPYLEPQHSYPEVFPYSSDPVYSSSPQRRPILSPPTEDTVAPYKHIHAPPPPVLRERDSAVAVSPGRYSRGHRLLSPQMGGEPKEAPPTKRMFC